MKIAQNTFVILEYKLTNESGEAVDWTEPGEPQSFVFGAGQIIPGLEKALEGMEEGQKAQIAIEPEEAYGVPDPSFFRKIPLDSFPDGVEINEGMRFETDGPGGPVIFKIRSLEGDTALADFNHPLAGQRLNYDLQVLEVREATTEELAQSVSGGCGSCSCDSGCC